MKMYKFWLKFPWTLFPRVQSTIFQHWFRSWLGAGQATNHYLNQWWLVYRRIYASLSPQWVNHFKFRNYGQEPVQDKSIRNMMTSSNGSISALLALCAGNSPVPGEYPAQRPVTRSFDVFFDLRLNKRLSKQSWGWWFETLSCPLWRH